MKVNLMIETGCHVVSCSDSWHEYLHQTMSFMSQFKSPSSSSSSTSSTRFLLVQRCFLFRIYSDHIHLGKACLSCKFRSIELEHWLPVHLTGTFSVTNLSDSVLASFLERFANLKLRVIAERIQMADHCREVPSQRPVEDQQQSTDACPTFGITVHEMSGKHFLLVVPVTQTLCLLKQQIASRLRARSSDLSIVFQSRLVGDDGSVRDFGLVDGSVLQVVRIARYVELVVFVHYLDSVRRPWRRAELPFRFDVPWNMPCAARIKAEVMRIFDGAGLQKMTNPHLFLMNEFHPHLVFSLGDEDCLDELADAFNPYEVYVIDQTQCRCRTCDLSWMLDGWRCRRVWQIWHAARSGWSDSSSSSDGDAS